MASPAGQVDDEIKDVRVVRAFPTGRRRWVTLGLLGASVVGAGAFVGGQAIGKPGIASVTPARDGAVANAKPPIVVALENADRISDLAVSVDGKDVTASVRGAGDRLVVTPRARLADGPHDVAVRFGTYNLLARTVSERWTFEVDTTGPGYPLPLSTMRGDFEVDRVSDARSTIRVRFTFAARVPPLPRPPD